MADDVRKLLQDAVPVRPPERGFEGVWQRSRALRVHKMVASGAVAIVVVVISALVLAGAGDFSSTVPPANNGTNERGHVDIEVGGFPSHVVTGDGSVWVAVYEDDGQGNATSFVKRIDPSTNQIIAEIPVASGLDAMTATRQAVWLVMNHVHDRGTPVRTGSVFRIDTATNEVTAGPIDFPGTPSFEVAADSRAVWVMTAGRGLVRIDPDTAQVVARLPIRSPDVAIQGDRVFVAGRGGPLVEVDLETNEVVRPGIRDFDPYELVGDRDFIWSVEALRRRMRYAVVRLDPDAPAETRKVRTGIFTGRLDVEGSSLWGTYLAGPKRERDRHGTIVRIDREATRIVAEFPPYPEPLDMAAGYGAVWLARGTDLVTRIPID